MVSEKKKKPANFKLSLKHFKIQYKNLFSQSLLNLKKNRKIHWNSDNNAIYQKIWAAVRVIQRKTYGVNVFYT